jgi:hypothetical protein
MDGICWLLPCRLKLVFPLGYGSIATVKVGMLRARSIVGAFLDKKTKIQNLSMGVHNDG